MKVSAQEEYGLRCALQLARAGTDGSLTIPEIAELEGLSTAYVAKLMVLLRQANLVRSERGRSGGYTLNRPVESISVADVLSALGGQGWEPAGCERFTGTLDVCVHTSACAVRHLWGTLDSVFDLLLRNITLADLRGGELKALQRFRLPGEFFPGRSDSESLPAEAAADHSLSAQPVQPASPR